MGDHTAVFADHIVDIATILKQRPRQASDHVKHVGRHYGKDQQRSRQANRGDKDGRGVATNRIRLTPAASIVNDEAVLVVPTSKRGSPTRAPLVRAQLSSANHTSSSRLISQSESRSPPVAVTTTAYIQCDTGNKNSEEQSCFFWGGGGRDEHNRWRLILARPASPNRPCQAQTISHQPQRYTGAWC